MRMKDCPCHQDAETPGTARPSRAGRLLILVTVLAAMVLQPGCGRRAPVERLRVRARTLREQKRYDRAATVAELALGVAENSYAPVSLEVAACLTELAAAYEGQGKHAKAEPLYRRALDIHQAVHARPHPDIVRDLNNLSALYQKLGRGEDSETCRKRALEAFHKTPLGASAWVMLAFGVVVLYGGLAACLTVAVCKRGASPAKPPSAPAG